jgi:hypothetical protein
VYWLPPYLKITWFGLAEKTFTLDEKKSDL